MKPLKFKRVCKDWHKADEYIAEAMIKVMMEYVKALRARLDEQGKKITQLETTRMKYCGVWKHGTAYCEGDFVTLRGCVWACVAPTNSATPGKSPAWRLAVKAGRDGKDAKA